MPKKKTREDFIAEARNIHGDKYDYSKVNYVNTITKVCIICPIHGEFWQRPDAHLHNKGCKKCGTENTKIKLTFGKTKFIEKAKQVHGDKYDYSKIEYKNYETKVCIICPEHGEFWQTPNSHLNGNSCPKCAIEINVSRKRTTLKEFITKAIKIHGDEYDYSKVVYANAHEKVCIVCPKHGEFWQSPNMHLSQKQRCPKCRQSYLENEIEKLLIENNIKFNPQWKNDMIGKKSVDFYLPEYNIAIECQGGQHFKPVDYFGGKEKFEQIKKRDEEKYKQLTSANIDVLYYTNVENIPKEFTEKHKYYTSLDEIFKKIEEKQNPST
ncbi:MAG: endonuclease domain-containing protein [Bacilli bacterium]|nr:endonuclease domain-containing protein [Bacilli bacterium]